ncbi:Peptidoglycan/LPS O-acetylase OafA/YrhL, contains acyltransferase and SGNH-hydrolase domains [Marinobacter gudaonensis]|uniref:Peptidoglycan/LPS O-acetylase OafA/YrhL, contains acyltransferase and SGNH-hydrolase domains n=1 Tax=Marinobacter gudaonensis TaxID=375760 RepID=A0A1I6GDX3_9GAMM|nr:acyltransferase [Marinobacter gudaonensis]SFR40311.1 Peptidoglycan/LPS O-acetylase OafA/YrhL, contains acyltransferase and SGNH-hydrolase domains [Marinobacter gudaonensis]
MADNQPRLAHLLQQRQLPGLDGFRMVAVASVVFYHAGIEVFFSARHGVAGFFVLSGFLITWLLIKEHALTGRVSLRDFYLRRSLRIFPAYYVFVFVTLSWDFMRGDPHAKEVLWPSLTYLMNYYNAIEGHPSSSVAHLWSLAIEEQFYLLWPILFIVLLRAGRAWAIKCLVVLAVLVMIWRSVVVSVLDWGNSWAYNAFDTRFDNLAIGCLMAFLLERERVQRVAETVSSQPWMPLVTLAFLGLSRSVANYHYEYGPAFTIDAILLAVLLVQLILLSQGKVFGWLNHRVVVYLGLLSYPIYLWHVRGLEAGLKLNMLPEALQVVAGVAIGLMMAAASYHLLETPFLRLKRHYQHRDKPGPEIATTKILGNKAPESANDRY